MPDPLDVEVVAVVERQRMTGALELVGNDAIVDPADGHLAPAVARGPARRPRTTTSCGSTVGMPHSWPVSTKSGRVFCVSGAISISTTSAGSCAADQHLARQRQVARRVEAAEMCASSDGGQVVHLAVGLGEHVLEGVERRERLQLDQARLVAAVGGRAPVRSPPGRRSAALPGPGPGSARGSSASTAARASASARKPVTRLTAVAAISSSSACGKKHGVSLTGNGSGRPGALAEPRLQPGVALRRPLAVEALAQRGHHRWQLRASGRPGHQLAQGRRSTPTSVHAAAVAAEVDAHRPQPRLDRRAARPSRPPSRSRQPAAPAAPGGRRRCPTSSAIGVAVPVALSKRDHAAS